MDRIRGQTDVKRPLVRLHLTAHSAKRVVSVSALHITDLSSVRSAHQGTDPLLRKRDTADMKRALD